MTAHCHLYYTVNGILSEHKLVLGESHSLLDEAALG